MSIPDSFRLQICIHLFCKHTGQHMLSLLTIFSVPIDEACRKFVKNLIKPLKIRKFWIFVISGVTLRQFYLEKCNKLFGKDYWTTNLFLLGPLSFSNSQSFSKVWQKKRKNFEKSKIFGVLSFSVQFETFSFRTLQLSPQKSSLDDQSFLSWSLKHSNARSLSKLWRKIIKTLKIGNFWDFCHFLCQFEIFSIGKHISSEMPTGQRISAMLSVFNILIYEVYRKFDKNCIKTVKIGNFFGFLSFPVLIWDIFHPENCSYLFIKACWTTNFCLDEPFQHSYPRYLSKNFQKLH